MPTVLCDGADPDPGAAGRRAPRAPLRRRRRHHRGRRPRPGPAAGAQLHRQGGVAGARPAVRGAARVAPPGAGPRGGGHGPGRVAAGRDVALVVIADVAALVMVYSLAAYAPRWAARGGLGV